MVRDNNGIPRPVTHRSCPLRDRGQVVSSNCTMTKEREKSGPNVVSEPRV